MPSKYTKIIMCPNCGAKLKAVVTNGVWPMRMTETGECPKCGSEYIQRLRRVTGYLTNDYKTSFNLGKQDEVEHRVRHLGKVD